MASLKKMTIVLFASLTTLLVACSTPVANDEDASPTGAVAQAYANATSDFERDVLKDGEITLAEYQEANSSYKACLSGKGIVVVPTSDANGLITYEVELASQEAFVAEAQEADRCSRGTSELISPTYSALVVNPDEVSFQEEVAACLVEEGLVESGFDGESFKELTESGSTSTETWPFDPTDSAFLKCLE